VAVVEVDNTELVDSMAVAIVLVAVVEMVAGCLVDTALFLS